MLELRLLGSVELRGPAGEFSAVLAQPKRLALLAYLAVARPRGFRRRDALLGMFWPELDEESARNALGQAVHFLRRELGKEVVVSRGREELGLAEGALWCDVVAFDEAITGGLVSDALRLYRGDLMPGFHVSGLPELERWIEDERGRLAAASGRAGTAELSRRTPTVSVGGAAVSARPAASIAVLPFLDLTPAGAAHLADGLADDIISGLATVRGVRVTSRTSAFGFRDRAVPTSRIGEELGVATILEGSVRLDGSRVLVAAQLIATDTEDRVWSQRYDRDVRDLFAIQQDIVERAARILSVELTTSDRRRLANRSGSPEAFQLYLRGRYHGSQGSTDGWERAVEYYRLALEADPTYALAYAGLADAYLQLPLFQFIPPIPRAAALERAKLAAARAVELDTELGEAHAALGVARWYDWDWLGAERSMQRAIQLNSAAAAVRQRYGVMLAALGRFDAAARELRRASELDPLSLYVAVDRGLVELRARRFDLAIAHFEKVLALNPAFPPALHYLAEARTYGGCTKPAAAEATPAPGETWHGLDHAESARLDELFRQSATCEQHAERAALLERTDAAPTIIAAAWGRAGHVDRGWSWLDRAADERDPTLADGVRVHPGLDAFRGTDRWKVLLRRLSVDDAGSWSE